MFRNTASKYQNLLIALTLSVLMTACAHREAPTAEKAPAPVTTTHTAHYTVLEFQPGKSSVRKSEQEKIKNLVRATEQNRTPISEVLILAWPDDVPNKSPALASQRAASVRAFLQSDLKKNSEIKIYNMTADPERFAELISDSKNNVTNKVTNQITYENTEAVSFGKGPKSSLAGNKASKVIVTVRYE